MNIDEKIKRELNEQSSEIDEILAEEKGIMDFVVGSYRSSLKIWFIIVNVGIAIMTGVFIWAGYEFFNAGNVSDQIFWGVCFLTAFIVQVAGKQWIWAEMSRSSLIREIKRVELTLNRHLDQLK
ncbi:DUF6768 family protein [Paraglaciecola sp.]|uniref:DUF6768 family protein n=1 Tax=Paraglaciecola sp. TaxID=1920173 RepID=UPI003EF5B505